ncbi:MAG: helix-turn-helix domain-containing protein, partial [Betaproteobacteria bacterium]|nr:helix-turn-helix domain-containing protein [Betaproteobacteria bacterium]
MSEADIGAAGAPAEAGGAAPGRRLAQARALHDLSPSDVARQLKLSVWQIEALEAGQFDRLPGPVFVRGFIRNYARLVKLDPEDLLQSAGDSLPLQAPRPATPPSQDIPFPTAQTRRWPGYAIAAAVLVAGLAFYEFY